jgi:hypothetical protein
MKQMKNFKQFVNESVNDEKIIFVRTKNFNNSGTVNKLPYEGIQCWAIYETDLDKYIEELELWGGNKKNVEIINPIGFSIYALNYTEAHKYVMGEISNPPKLEKFDDVKHRLNFIKQGGKSMLAYASDLSYQIILTK